jgi:outer membrane immunogenic protein
VVGWTNGALRIAAPNSGERGTDTLARKIFRARPKIARDFGKPAREDRKPETVRQRRASIVCLLGNVAPLPHLPRKTSRLRCDNVAHTETPVTMSLTNPHHGEHMFRKFLLSSVALAALLSAITVFLVFSGIRESRAECIFPCIHNSGAALAADDPSMAPAPVYVPPPVLAALAADVPSMAPPPVYVPPPVFTWTGFYVGVNGGGAAGSTDLTFNAVGLSAQSNSFGGGFVGGTIGYDYQWNGPFVVGILADADWASITNGGACSSISPFFNCSANGNFLGSVRGRIGYAWERVLFYASGGLGLGNARFTVTDNITGGTLTDNVFRAGFTVGGGIEYALVPNWAVKFEYLFYDFERTTFGPGVLDVGSVTLNTFVHTFRLGIDYKFQPPPPPPQAPVVAKY